MPNIHCSVPLGYPSYMMSTRLTLLCVLIVASLACFLSGEDTVQHAPYVQGQNGTVLFLSNSEHGLCNVHMATASALLEIYPDMNVHYASFPSVREKLETISTFARLKTPATSNIIFHELKGLTFGQAILKEGRSFISAPGRAGIASLAEHMQLWISPWTAEDHIGLFEELGNIIGDVDPAVVVLDTWFRPAIDATRNRSRQHAFISPNTLVDNFIGIQPLRTMFWKYPA